MLGALDVAVDLLCWAMIFAIIVVLTTALCGCTLHLHYHASDDGKAPLIGVTDEQTNQSIERQQDVYRLLGIGPDGDSVEGGMDN